MNLLTHLPMTGMTINNISYTLEEAKAQKCRNNLFFFFKEFWSEIIPDELYLNWHIKFLCDELQKIAEGVIRGDKLNDDLVCNICPGTTKSTIISIILPAWLWTRKPDCVTLCNTISDRNANEFSQKFRDIVMSEKYKLYFPEIIIRNDSTAVMRVKNTHGGARRQFTTKSKITGDHGHIRIDDDPMAFQDARSDAESERCIDGYKAYSTREKKNAYVPYILFMQRLSAQDTCTYVFKTKPTIKKIILPAWDNGKIYPVELKEKYVDSLLNPKHINQDFLDKKKLTLGDLQYLAEYGQDCETSEGYLYTIQKVKEIEQKGISIAVCDPAEDGDCYTATVFAYIHSNKCFIHDIIYTQVSPEDKMNGDEVAVIGTHNLNINKAKQHKPYAFYIEKDGIGNSYGKAIKSKYPLVVPFAAKGGRTDGPKEDRIYAKGNIISKYFYFLEQSPSLQYENAVNHLTTYKRVGKNKFKDIEDALTSLATIIEKNHLINFYG
jgi:hypothetical protein